MNMYHHRTPLCAFTSYRHSAHSSTYLQASRTNPIDSSLAEVYNPFSDYRQLAGVTHRVAELIERLQQLDDFNNFSNSSK